ncbi:MAG: ABC transporter ATP-binding protein [Candidatus Odinarchaeum yellowstonii]|uniref:ABC transporter ATP-binding protein n=1 Tax=Odinarchaeota yellowstonii (strain LCB_4) TaxID=1841599 RepID=A0AAF0D3L7_ODILC|nr:MAG: ABC transporter ATP-binding protein [Candidatus Odinarchaeum yellowstonii]
MSKIEIKCVNVCKVYKLGVNIVKALDNINLTIMKGDYISIMGPSGSGKTTLLNIIGALDHPTSGRVYLDGCDITDLPERKLTFFRRNKIGFIFQAFYLIPTLTALDNVLTPIIPRGIKPADRERALTLLEMLGLKNRVNHKPGELSGGERQRVAIARALVSDPPIILGDEITGELDSKTGQEIMDIMERLNTELDKTIVIVTHDVKVARRAKINLRMEDGRIFQE